MITLKVSSTTMSQLRKLKTKLHSATASLMNRTKPHQESKEWMIDRWDLNFHSEGGIYDAWPALAETTLEDRFYKGFPSGPMLIREGELLNHFTSLNRLGVVGRDFTTWSFENGEPGWPVSHHLGINWSAYQPPRKLWDMNEEDEDKIRETFELYVKSVMDRFFK